MTYQPEITGHNPPVAAGSGLDEAIEKALLRANLVYADGTKTLVDSLSLADWMEVGTNGDKCLVSDPDDLMGASVDGSFTDAAA